MPTIEFIEKLETLSASHDFKAIIDACSGSNHSTINSIWANSMRAVYGYAGMHASWRDDNGHPTPEALAKFANLAIDMQAAKSEVLRLIAWLRRERQIRQEMDKHSIAGRV